MKTLTVIAIAFTFAAVQANTGGEDKPKKEKQENKQEFASPGDSLRYVEAYKEGLIQNKETNEDKRYPRTKF